MNKEKLKLWCIETLRPKDLILKAFSKWLGPMIICITISPRSLLAYTPIEYFEFNYTKSEIVIYIFFRCIVMIATLLLFYALSKMYKSYIIIIATGCVLAIIYQLPFNRYSLGQEVVSQGISLGTAFAFLGALIDIIKQFILKKHKRDKSQQPEMRLTEEPEALDRISDRAAKSLRLGLLSIVLFPIAPLALLHCINTYRRYGTETSQNRGSLIVATISSATGTFSFLGIAMVVIKAMIS